MSEEKNWSRQLNNKTSKNKVFCCVYGCSSKAWTNPELSFHYFPRNGEKISLKNKLGNLEEVDRRKTWEKYLKMGKKTTAHMRVCSLHFSKDAYNHPDCNLKKNYLKKTAVPTCNLPLQFSPDEEKNNCNNLRTVRRLNREKCKNVNELFNSESDIHKDKKEESIPKSMLNDELQNQSDENYEKENEIPNTKINKGVQVQSGDLFIPFYETVLSDQELSSLTGIPTFKVFNGIVELLVLAAPQIQKSSKLSVEDKVLMTFMKLKNNMSYSVLKFHFKCCTVQNCRKNILKMIDILSVVLEFAIVFPTKDEISNNMPKCFENFLQARASVDCTEIPTQKPSNLCCQMSLFSHYKGCFTTKIMTAVSPSGHLIFRSKAYGGRASDKAIFEQSNFIKLLDKGDEILTDKGFLIDDICKNYDIKLIRPAFLRQKKQFSREEALLNSSISSARVHVERYNQRIKAFKILNSRLPSGLIGKIDKIFTIVCATINLSSPILSDDKYFT